mmetsp:Transcript_40256/g.131531  ORF Transcript_40256/g.131531 Transcript_40256/m.131531 type:complete len:712 (-) Transcript_40256:230-2365(-)
MSSSRKRRLSNPLPKLAEYSCSRDEKDDRAGSSSVLGMQLRGVNLHGWLVLQPWVTPSLFYQFEGKGRGATAFDMHGFCRVLGPSEANRQLRQHWRAWVTERDLARLASQGINTLRIPVGDWMWEPYEPYVGCTDGAIDELWRVIHLCKRVGLQVLIDLHGVRGSQNGFDNSGHTQNVTWTDDSHFEHWPHRSAGWQGSFDPLQMVYTDISWSSIRATVQVLEAIATSLRNLSPVIGVEALNEPWQYTPLDVLRAFYWEGYWAVRAAAPHWLYVIHDSFRVEEWRGYMRGCDGVALDTHVYQAWFDIRPQSAFLDNICSWRDRIRSLQDSALPLLVGEWSLATDNCAMWLNGFHDNAPGYPKVECGAAPCPQPYVSGIAGPPADADPPAPFGSGVVSAPRQGLCPLSKGWADEDDYQARAAAAYLTSFDSAVGWFFMNFKAELQPHWSWGHSHARGWLPPNATTLPTRLYNVCRADGGGRRGGPMDGSSDLPWYNSLPRPHGASSSVALLFGVGLGTLCATAAILKGVLLLVSLSNRPLQNGRLQLPPRLLTLARKSQTRKPGGLGPLGLKHRVSSRSLVQYTHPLMAADQTIVEVDEEAVPQIDPAAEYSWRSSRARNLLSAAQRLLPSSLAPWAPELPPLDGSVPEGSPPDGSPPNGEEQPSLERLVGEADAPEAGSGGAAAGPPPPGHSVGVLRRGGGEAAREQASDT